MAKKNKKIRETTIEDFYDLKTDKVDELVAALKGEDTDKFGEVSMNIADCTGDGGAENYSKRGRQKQFDPYKTDFLSRIPVWLKAIFVKWWFAGVVCYFVMWGLRIENDLDRVVLVGAVMGIVVDILVNPLLRYMETDKREYNAYIMFPFPFKAFWTFFANIIYYVAVVLGVMYCYLGLNLLIIEITGRQSVLGGVEPLLFGVFAVAVDMIFIGIKDLIVKLIKRKKKEGEANV